jgi:asparagine synthase (glutamine-hydrolysing)
MSGIIGIINLDGSHVDRDLLRRMTDFMTFRGPDAQEIWFEGNVGFGHTMLRTTWEAETEKQPLTLDGKVWLTADARIDGRTELIAELEAKLRRRIRINESGNGSGPERLPNDAELILLAYEAWGDDCVEHLIGDFAFAIWDARAHRLFCARDHFGVKPFFYAKLDKVLIFSNTLNCARLHPAVSDRINEHFIGDFLLFDMCYNASITVFADVQRLRPGHTLICDKRGVQMRRYWVLPDDGKIRYRRSTDYVEHFNELMHKATGDRLRTKQAGVFMSGGIDSPTVATFAHEILSKGDPFELRAYTVVYDRLFKDQERHYSQLVADQLEIPIHFLVVDDYDLYDGAPDFRPGSPEPSHDPLAKISLDQMRWLAQYSRVVLTGYGLDPALAKSYTYGPDLIKRLRLAELTRSAAWFLFVRRQFPALGFRGWLKNFGRPVTARYPNYPRWLNDSFVRRINLRERWEEINNQPIRTDIERPQAYESLTSPFWPFRFEDFDPASTHVSCEVRHPFFDVRLMTYLLAVPAVPCCIEKELIRRAMRGRLPEAVRTRPKAVLGSDPIALRQRSHKLRWIDDFPIATELSQFVDKSLLPPLAEEVDSNEVWTNTRVFSLSLWFHGLTSNKSKAKQEISYGASR